MEILSSFAEGGGEMLARWGHVLAGITWIGLLYFFNFVQTPAFAEMSPEARGESFDKITWRALWWFRWAAMLTFLTGISIIGLYGAREDFDYAQFFSSQPGTSIAWGAILATTMFLNVWLVIWPNQQIVIGSERAKLAGQEGDPRQPEAAKRGARASRANTLFSIPMLWFMVFTSHFSFNYVDPAGGKLAVAWLVFIVLWLFVEASALGLLGGLDNGFNKNVFDKHQNTIIGGFVLWVLLFIGCWELIIGS